MYFNSVFSIRRHLAKLYILTIILWIKTSVIFKGTIRTPNFKCQGTFFILFLFFIKRLN